MMIAITMSLMVIVTTWIICSTILEYTRQGRK